MTVYPNAHNAHVEKRIHHEGVSPDDYVKIAEKAIYGKNKQLLPSPSETGIHNVMYANTDNPSGRVMMGNFNDGLSLKSVQQINDKRLDADIKKAQAKLGTPLVDDDSQAVSRAVSSLDSAKGMNPIDNPLGTRDLNIAQSDQNVNDSVKHKLASDESVSQPQLAYDHINNHLISYDYQDIGDIQQLYQQYGNDFTEHLNHAQKTIYEHLLDQAPCNQQRRYQDPIIGEAWIDKVISRDDGSKYVQVDKKIVNDHDDNYSIRQKIKQTIAEKFQGNQYQVGDTNVQATVTGKTKNELSYKQKNMNDSDYRHKANMTGNLDEILNTMTDARVVPNKKSAQKPYVDHYISGRTEVEIDGHLYYPRVDIEVGKNGQVIAYDIADIQSIKKEPWAEADNRSYMRETNSALDNQGSVSTSNLPQADENVKFKLSEDAQEASDFYYNDYQSSAEMRQDLINRLWEANKKGQGVDHIFHEAENALDDTYMVRASNNSPFYSEYWQANGKKPTKTDIGFSILFKITQL